MVGFVDSGMVEEACFRSLNREARRALQGERPGKAGSPASARPRTPLTQGRKLVLGLAHDHRTFEQRKPFSIVPDTGELLKGFEHQEGSVFRLDAAPRPRG